MLNLSLLLSCYWNRRDLDNIGGTLCWGKVEEQNQHNAAWPADPREGETQGQRGEETKDRESSRAWLGWGKGRKT